MPYNAAFLEAQGPAFFYDRFAPDDLNNGAMRQCFAGYHHALVGADSPDNPYFDTIALPHFRGHYRRMNFVAHLEFAALLTFSRRMTDLVKRGQLMTAQSRATLHQIRQDFLNFTHRYVFTDVSNHLQAREMNAKLRASMGLDTLRQDVEGELRASSDFALAAEQRDMAQAQSRLSMFATLFLPVTLAAGLAGMNILTNWWGDQASLLHRLTEAGVWLGLAFGVGWLVLWRMGVDDQDSRRLRKWLCVLALTMAVATGVLAALNHYAPDLFSSGRLGMISCLENIYTFDIK